MVMPSLPLPSVAILTLGGTIASVPQKPGEGATPSLTADDLVTAVPQLADVADIKGTSFRQFPSGELTLEDLFALAAEIDSRIRSGVDGVVVTQGTDTLEETAFTLDLLLGSDAPVVVTGAMRNPSLPGADGPANLLAAVAVAASTEARGLGSVVVFNDEIHAARFVQKTHTSNPATFHSALTGPLGWLREGRPRIVTRPSPRQHLPVPADTAAADVALLKLTLGQDGRLLDCAGRAGYQGLVIEAFGGGHTPQRMVEPLGELARRMPVVLASRTGAGEMLRETYGFPGGERDLLSRGLISAGALDGLKARLLLTVLLSRGATRAEIDAAFEAVGFGGSPARE